MPVRKNRDRVDIPELPRRRGISVVPFVGDLLAMTRLLRDPRAAAWAKLLALAAVAYVVWPLDALPDAAPLIAWIDDVGLVLALRLLMNRQLEPYRYPLGARPPQLVEQDAGAAHA
jgi:uncharacterized membrane protein YkvA (DUF1232 family)